MLNITSLLLPGERIELLLDLQKEWYAACDATEPAHKARVDAAIATDWICRRADQMYHQLRTPSTLETAALGMLARRRGELRYAVRVYRNLLGYSTRRAKLRHVFQNAEDFDDIQINAS